MSKLPSSRLIRVAVAVCVLATAAAAAIAASADDKAAAAAAAPAARSTDGRYFEMRTYHAAPGKLDTLHARFRDHTMRLFKKHDIESVAYWVAEAAEAGAERDTLVFVLAYPSREARDTSWKAFAADPEWVKAKADSEKDGPLVEKVDQTFMTPADYSPLK